MTHSDLDPTVPVVGSFYAFKARDHRASDPNVLELPGIANGMPRPAVDFPQTQTFTSTAYGSQIRFTEILFVAGERNVDINMYSPSPHEVYENTYSTPEYIQWLFAQSK
jgi:hypothetical protein